jgi:hypothetical protein
MRLKGDRHNLPGGPGGRPGGANKRLVPKVDAIEIAYRKGVHAGLLARR